MEDDNMKDVNMEDFNMEDAHHLESSTDELHSDTTWSEMIQRFGLLNLISIPTSSSQKVNIKNITIKTFKLFNEMVKRVDDGKKLYEEKYPLLGKELNAKLKLRTVLTHVMETPRQSSLTESDVIKLYTQLFRSRDVIIYLIYEFILNTGLLLSFTNYEKGDDTHNLYEQFDQSKLEHSSEVPVASNKASNAFFTKLTSIVRDKYGNSKKSVFFSVQSFIELYNLIYKDFYEAIHSEEEELDTDKLLDSVVDKCINKLVSLEDKGVEMIFAIALQFPITFLYHTKDNMDNKTHPSPSQQAPPLRPFSKDFFTAQTVSPFTSPSQQALPLRPFSKDFFTAQTVSPFTHPSQQAPPLRPFSNDFFAPPVKPFAISQRGIINNTSIKKLKLKKQTTKKIQHKFKKQKDTIKYKLKNPKQSKQHKSIFNKTLKKTLKNITF